MLVQCSDVDALFGCLGNDWKVKQCSGVNTCSVFMQCLSVHAMFGCRCNVWVLMQCLVVDAMFRGWCNVGVSCKVLMLMKCSDVYAIFWCWCNVLVLMQCSGVDAMFWCWWKYIRWLSYIVMKDLWDKNSKLLWKFTIVMIISFFHMKMIYCDEEFSMW